MTSRPRTRPLTPTEREHLEAQINGLHGGVWEEIRILAWLWVSILIFLMPVWALATWVARVFFEVDIGWDGQWAGWILGSGIVLATSTVALLLFRQLRSKARWERSLASDLETGVVEEQHLELVAARRFQEPEHGGLIYCLLTSENEVFVLYDHDSWDLGVAGENPLESDFKPRRTLTVVRAPRSRWVLHRAFSGEPLQIPHPREMTAKPDLWPPSDEFCETPWEELEATLAA